MDVPVPKRLGSVGKKGAEGAEIVSAIGYARGSLREFCATLGVN